MSDGLRSCRRTALRTGWRPIVFDSVSFEDLPRLGTERLPDLFHQRGALLPDLLRWRGLLRFHLKHGGGYQERILVRVGHANAVLPAHRVCPVGELDVEVSFETLEPCRFMGSPELPQLVVGLATLLAGPHASGTDSEARDALVPRFRVGARFVEGVEAAKLLCSERRP